MKSKTIVAEAKDNSVETSNLSSESPQNNHSKRSIMDWLYLIYLFGVIVLLANLLFQIISILIKIYKSNDRIKDTGAIIVNSTKIKEPCSFFNYIFINPEQYDFDVYEQIIAHEKIHVKQHHSLDLLLAEISVIVMWFNPFAWLFRKEVEKNIEYQTDHLLIENHYTEKDDYQMNLLKIATYKKPLTITTNYNQSLIKKRILKMNTKKSNPHSYWKYAFTMPLFFLLLLALNKPQLAFAQELAQPIDEKELQTLTKTDYFSDCEAFKNALEAKDIDKLKTMLINLDPECENYLLSIKDNSLATVQSDLKEGAELEIDTTGNIVVKSSTGEVTETLSPMLTETEVTYSTDCKALLKAIRVDDIESVRSLLNTIDPNCIDPNPGFETKIVNGNTWNYQKAKTPLMAVSRTGNLAIAKLLTSKGADVKKIDRNSGTPLMSAAAFGHLDLVKYFVGQGADVNLKLPNQGTALIAAANNGSLDIIKYLISEGADVNAFSPNQGNALIAAANHGNLDVIEYLLNKDMDVNFISPNQGNALIASANNGHLNSVKYLVKHGAEINKISPNQGTPLIAAANNGHNDVINYLLTKGAEINKISPNQGTALIAAANNGHLETIKLLIGNGSDVNRNTPNQGSALTAAANNGHTEVMEYLISNGSDINNNTNNHGSALIAAARNGQNDVVNYLLEQGANINSQNNGQGSALNAAARNGHNSIIKLLLKKGADIDAQTNGQGSALNAASRNGHLDTVELLLDNGADINLQNNGQGSALNAAARNGQLKTVKYLVEHGADVNLYSNGQGTALSAASKNGYNAIVDYLISKGAKHIYGNQ